MMVLSASLRSRYSCFSSSVAIPFMILRCRSFFLSSASPSPIRIICSLIASPYLCQINIGELADSSPCFFCIKLILFDRFTLLFSQFLEHSVREGFVPAPEPVIPYPLIFCFILLKSLRQLLTLIFYFIDLINELSP